MCVLRRLPQWLLVIGWIVTWSSGFCDAEEAVTPPGRPLPFYPDIEPESAFDSVDRSEASRSPLSNLPESSGTEMAGHSFQTSAKSKTPLPDWDQAASESTPPITPSRIGTTMWWVAGLLLAGWAGTRYFKANGPLRMATTSPLELLSRQSVGSQQQLILVRLGQQVLLIGATPASMTTLAQVTDPEQAAQLLQDLRPVAGTAMGPTVLDLFRSRRTEGSAPLAGATFSTSPVSRSTAPSPPRTVPEVSDV